MAHTYYLLIRSGDFRNSDGLHVQSYTANNVAKAIEEILNDGYSFLCLTDSYVFFVKTVE